MSTPESMDFNSEVEMMTPDEQEEWKRLDEAQFTGKNWNVSDKPRLDELNAKKKRIRERDDHLN